MQSTKHIASLITFSPTLLPLVLRSLSSVSACRTEQSQAEQRRRCFMEGVSTSMRRALKKYWRRRGYQRLINGKRSNVVELGGGGRRRRWRIKVVPKIRIPRVSSPKKMMLWVRDAYVRMMMGLASSKVVSMGVSVTGDSFGRAPPIKEYDDKMMVRMYNSLILAQRKKLHHGSNH